MSMHKWKLVRKEKDGRVILMGEATLPNGGKTVTPGVLVGPDEDELMAAHRLFLIAYMIAAGRPFTESSLG